MLIVVDLREHYPHPRCLSRFPEIYSWLISLHQEEYDVVVSR